MWSETSVGDWAAVGDADVTEPADTRKSRIAPPGRANRWQGHGRTRCRVRRVPGACPVCPQAVSRSVLMLGSRTFAHIWSRDAPLRHPRLWPVGAAPSP